MWMKIDDKLHAHRKTRRVLTNGSDKRRDASPMGLWVLAGSWAGQNGTSGWVPEHELDRWDDDWEDQASRLVKAGFWWPEQKDDEPGYGFVDWEEYNPANGSAEAGEYGNHVRWHVKRKIVEPDCQHCPKEPDHPEDSGGDIGGRSGGDIAPDSPNIALPEPDPTRTRPLTPSSTDVDQSDRFEEFWDIYGKKVGRKVAEKRWALALKKKGVTADLLIDAARTYIGRQVWDGKHPKFTKDPATWLNGEHWTDDVPVAPTTEQHRLPTVEEMRRMEAEREARERGRESA